MVLMLRYMLDTDICIYVGKNKPQGLQQRFNEMASQICVSSVTVAELAYGAHKSAQVERNLSQLEAFLAKLAILDFAADAAFHTGEIKAGLRKTGQPIGPYDLMIAGHARSQALILVTNNSREFERVPGLRLENWS